MADELTTSNSGMSDKDKVTHGNWTSFLNHTRERTWYAVKRMDLLIISICGAGIYIIFETFKSIAAKELINVSNVELLKISGIMFLSAIITNFISQRTGYYSNNYREKYTLLQIHKIEGNEINEELQNDHDCKAKSFNRATNILNNVSIGLMLIGLLLLVIFNYTLPFD